MSPVVDYLKKEEVHLKALTDETIIGLKETTKGVIILQNDEVITLVEAPIMRVVKGIRTMFPNAKFERYE